MQTPLMKWMSLSVSLDTRFVGAGNVFPRLITDPFGRDLSDPTVAFMPPTKPSLSLSVNIAKWRDDRMGPVQSLKVTAGLDLSVKG